MRSNKYWIACCCAAVILVILTFTPLVIPDNTYKPMLFGLPYSLWTGILICVCLVFLTFVAGKVHPGNESEGKK